jgi:hypothetical protein
MNRTQLSAALFTTVMGVITVAPTAVADEWDKKTIVTTGEPIQVPGVTLEPGKYVFKLADSQSDRHIVVIQNERMNHTYATLLAIPNYRLQPTGKSQFLFWETPAGQPKALRAWFYPGDNFGQEFPYKKNAVTQVAQVNTHTEPPAPPAAEPAPPPPPQESTEVARNEAPPPPAPVAAPEPAPAPAPPAAAPRVIPQTAGIIPLLTLIGFLSVGLSLGFGALAKRVS